MNKISLLLLFVGLLNMPMHAQEDLLLSVESAYGEANYASSLEESLKIIKQGSVDSAAMSIFYAYAGLSSEELGDVSNAMTYYKKAIEFKVPRLDIYNKMIAMAKDQGDHNSYEYGLLCQAEEFPDFREDVLILLNKHYYYTKQYEKLLGTSKELLALYPDDLKFNYYAAVGMQKLSHADEAKALYEKVISQDGNHLGANRALGVLLYKEAAATFKAQTKKYEAISKPSRVDYHNYLQDLESSKTTYKKSLPYLIKADELKPNESIKGLIKNAHSHIGEVEK